MVRTRAAAAEASETLGAAAAEADAVYEELAAFLEVDLPHLFDEVGIDSSKYAPGVKFTDPITKCGWGWEERTGLGFRNPGDEPNPSTFCVVLLYSKP